MSDLKVCLTLPMSLAQKGHCILCGNSPLMVEKQSDLPDRFRCIQCNLALEMDTTRQFMRIVDLPKGLSVNFNPEWMRISDLKKYIKDLFNHRVGTSSTSEGVRVSAPVSSTASDVHAQVPQAAAETVSAPPLETFHDAYPGLLETFESSPTLEPRRSAKITTQVGVNSQTESLSRWSEVTPHPSEHHGRWICPFLKLENNPTISLAYASQNSACYKIPIPQLVSMAYQKETCLSGRSALCPVTAAGFEGPLPPEILGKPRPKFTIKGSLSRLTSVLAVLLILGAMAYILNVTGVSSAFVNLLSVLGLPVQAWSGSHNLPIPHSTLFASEILTSTPQTNTYSQDVILGPENQYTVHILLEGESMDILARTYHMTPEAIKKVNPRINDRLEPLMVLVMVPGNQSLDKLVPLQAIRIEKETNLPDLLTSYKIDKAVFQIYNQSLGNQILPGQWIILPYPNKK